MSPSLVEAAVRTMREWGVPGTDGGLTILAEEVLVAVGDALRLEGAQARDAELRAVIEARRAESLATANDMTLADSVGWPAAQAAETLKWVLDKALGGVHPDATQRIYEER